MNVAANCGLVRVVGNSDVRSDSAARTVRTPLLSSRSHNSACDATRRPSVASRALYREVDYIYRRTEIKMNVTTLPRPLSLEIEVREGGQQL